MSKVRWGVIGTGSIANAFAHSIKHCNHSELISVFGRNKETLQIFSKKFDVTGINDIDELVSSNEIDAIYIATPHSSHFEYALQAINNKNMSCVKSQLQ